MWCYVQYFIYPNTILPQNILIITAQQGELAAKASAEKNNSCQSQNRQLKNNWN